MKPRIGTIKGNNETILRGETKLRACHESAEVAFRFDNDEMETKL